MKEGLRSPLYNETLERKKVVCVRLYYSDIMKSKRSCRFNTKNMNLSDGVF